MKDPGSLSTTIIEVTIVTSDLLTTKMQLVVVTITESVKRDNSTLQIIILTFRIATTIVITIEATSITMTATCRRVASIKITEVAHIAPSITTSRMAKICTTSRDMSIAPTVVITTLARIPILTDATIITLIAHSNEATSNNPLLILRLPHTANPSISQKKLVLDLSSPKSTVETTEVGTVT